MVSDMSEKHRRLLGAIAVFPNGQASAWDIANKMGYRPSRMAIPAVAQMCRAINRKYPSDETNEYAEVGKYLVRIPPRDQWASAFWCITREGRAAVSNGQRTEGE